MERSMGLTKAIRALCRMELGLDMWKLLTAMAIIPHSMIPHSIIAMAVRSFHVPSQAPFDNV